MTISRPCYCTRDDVKNALDIKETARATAQVDRAIQSAAEVVESNTHRVFYPQIDTRFWDWPNYDRSYPWRLWLDANEVISVSALSSGGIAIPSNQFFLRAGKGDSGPPFSRIELDRSTNAAWHSGATPQRAISVTGVFGYRADTAPSGTLAAAMTDTTGTSVTVSDSSAIGAGSSLLIDTERLLVADTAMASTSQTQQGSGAGTAFQSDVALSVTDGTKYAVGEVLLLDSERMKIADIAGNVLTVLRAQDGSVLATHSGATIFARRLLTVVRGVMGTTAATHLNAAPVLRHAPPNLIRDVAIAEAVNQFLQETSGYSRTVGSADNIRNASGAGLADLWAEVMTTYGRKSRRRTI